MKKKIFVFFIISLSAFSPFLQAYDQEAYSRKKTSAFRMERKMNTQGDLSFPYGTKIMLSDPIAAVPSLSRTEESVCSHIKPGSSFSANNILIAHTNTSQKEKSPAYIITLQGAHHV